MPVVYVPGDGTYYIYDFAGETHKEKIGGVDPTQEPGYVRQSASSNSSSSSSVNQSLADPAQLAIEQQRVQNEITKTQNDYAIALRNGDQRAAEYAQTRLDDLAKYGQTLQFQYTQLAQTASEGAANRGLTSSEGAANRAVTTGEGALNREQQAQLAAINNALSASQYAAQNGLSVAEFQQKQQTDALNAAKQFADLISSTDTAALPAFYKAGGGVIANALAGGKDALSDNALLPAARTLRAIANPVQAPAPFDPTKYSASQFMVTPAQTYQQQVMNAAAQGQYTPGYGGSIPGATNVIGKGVVDYGAPPVRMPNQAVDNSGSSGPNGSANGTLGVVNGRPVWAPTGSNSTSGYAYGTGGGPIMRYMNGTGAAAGASSSDGEYGAGLTDYQYKIGVADARSGKPPLLQRPPQNYAEQAYLQGYQAGTQTDADRQVDQGSTPLSLMPRYAMGTDVPVNGQTQFISGDSTAPNPAAGGAHPEAVSINDPTGDATFSVNPLTPPGVGDTDGDDDSGSIGSLLIAIGNFLDAQEDKQAGPIAAPMQQMMAGGMDGGMPRFALGTVPDPSGIAPEDLSFLDQVRQLRQSVDTTPPIEGGYFNVGFGNLAPSLQNSYYQSLQTGKGVPTADSRFEANRFAVPGVSRNDFTSGYGGGAKQDI